jgi:uncharacterized repeat protein (TIGR01451 family)
MEHFFSSCKWRIALALSVLLFLTLNLQAQCNPDVTPPTAVCSPTIFLSLSSTGPSEVDYSAFDNGSTDDCCVGFFELKRVADGPCDSDGLPDDYTATVTFCCEDLGTPVVVSMRVSDCSGNSSECLTTVTVEDKINPVCPSSFIEVSCEDFDPSLVAYGPTDNCCIDTVVALTTDYSQFNDVCLEGVIFRTFSVADCYGNTASCNQFIAVTYEQNYFVKFPDDVVDTNWNGNGNYGEPTIFGENCELIGISFSDQVFNNAPNGEIRLERTWTVINWCTYDPNGPVIEVPNPNPNVLPNHPDNLPGPVVSASGSPVPWAPTVSLVNPNDPTPTDYSTFWNADANAYQYTQIISNQYFTAVEGLVFSDSSANCTYETGESLLESWTVRAIGLVTQDTVEVLTDANGYYFIALNGADTSATITLVASSNFGQNCQTEYTVNIPVLGVTTQNVPVHLEGRCGLLQVGVATSRLRRCFDNRYTVQGCNLSDQNITDAYVEVSLDDYFDYVGSSVPGTLVSGNTYSFELGDLAAGDCYTFTVDFNLSCDAPLGVTHCTEAFIFPYDDCRDNSSWSGADVKVSATCDGDSVRFAITNIGSSDMAQALDFVVVEDVIMRQDGSFQLNAGQSMTFSEPANGSTWRLEAQEEVLHPWGGPQAVALEGCGGLNTTGLVNIFHLSNNNPFEALDCRENIGAYDPNDKQGFPTGFGSQRFIKANNDLEYLIRFQNTGTDTAFNVVILDALAPQLDAASVRVQVASHPMEFALLEGNVLRFTFNNILLPDSNVNQAASNGFVKFRVAQQPDLPDGTLIENSAAIYFDFNDPIITNTTLHTIGKEFLSVSTDELVNDGLLRAFPNPASDAVTFELKEWASAGRFELTNKLGQQVSAQRFTGNQFRFERKNLPAGIYHFQILSGDVRVAAGKVVLK